MSFCTSFSSNLRPMRRLMAYRVFFGLVTACRLAGAPTRTSPSSMYATIEGVVRAPSEFSITLGLPPSMIATQEFVVPRSIPMIFPMVFLLNSLANNPDVDMGVNPPTSSLRVLGLRDRHQRGPDHPIVEGVPLLKHVDYGVWLLLGRQHADGLMPMGVEFLAAGIDLLQAGLPEHGAQLLQGQLDPVLQRLQRGGIGGERRLKAILDRKELDGHGFDGVLVGVGQLDRGPLADVVRLGLRSKPGVVMLRGLCLGLTQELARVGGLRLPPCWRFSDLRIARGGRRSRLIRVRHTVSAK